jgi:hypothetical protein
MLNVQRIPIPPTSVHGNGQAAGKTATGQTDSVKQRRALRKLLRDLVAFAGVAAVNLASAPRKTPQRNRERLLYRRADTLSDDEVKSIVVALGPERVLRAVDKLTAPELQRFLRK